MWCQPLAFHLAITKALAAVFPWNIPQASQVGNPGVHTASLHDCVWLAGLKWQQHSHGDNPLQSHITPTTLALESRLSALLPALEAAAIHTAHHCDYMGM